MSDPHTAKLIEASRDYTVFVKSCPTKWLITFHSRKRKLYYSILRFMRFQNTIVENACCFDNVSWKTYKVLYTVCWKIWLHICTTPGLRVTAFLTTVSPRDAFAVSWVFLPCNFWFYYVWVTYNNHCTVHEENRTLMLSNDCVFTDHNGQQTRKLFGWPCFYRDFYITFFP